jgi:lipopolysaccharide/colanic/teichoic acid biosynthesis glycosyltransferase
VPVSSELLRKAKHNLWIAFSNGRFVTQMNAELLDKVLAETQADVLAVNSRPDLLAYREKVLLTADGKVAGFRRVYADSIEPAPMPSDWPHHVFVKRGALDRILSDSVFPASFSAFLERCNSAALRLSAIDVAGLAFDLDTEEGLLNFCGTHLSKIRNSKLKIENSDTISPTSRLVGKVLLGKNVEIGPDAVVVGPTIICNGAKIEEGSAIDSSIIFQGATVQRGEFIQNRVIREAKSSQKNGTASPGHVAGRFFYRSISLDKRERTRATFRTWPWFSYARALKRIADVVAALIVLILFAPLTPLIVLAIKLTSPGPAFFKDKRQGLHGKAFNCLKFRTMHVGAGEIQERLRVISQVDGPQFKIAEDPRISTAGRFLRDTFLDEIPQFLNVLLGQMSVIGPRPSPESENTLCPWWRDARLSVRPGITGLWQVCRTRQPGKDFQEWIHYDTEYVRNLSLRMDLWICWQTVKKIARDFVRQFY